MRAELADGRILEFPDGTDPLVVQTAVKKMISGQGKDSTEPTSAPQNTRQQAMEDLAKETGFWDALGTSIGKGFTNVGRGLNLGPEFGITEQDQSEIEKEAMTALGEERPITTAVGEAIGEAAPFVAMAGPAGMARTLPARMLGTGSLAATEGAVIERGRGGDAYKGATIGAGVGMAAEVLFPVLGRLGRSLYQRVRGVSPKGAMLTPAGTPTPELQEAMDAVGMSFDDLAEDALSTVNKQSGILEPTQVARKEFLESQGITPTKAQITREAVDFQAQQEAAKTSGRVRTALELQDAALTTRFNNAVTATGGATGKSTNPVIDYVVGKSTELDSAISSLYKKAREVAPGAKNVRLAKLGQTLRAMSPSDRRMGGNVEAISGILKEKGVMGKNFKIQGKIDVETSEEIRQLMNSLYDPQNEYGNIGLRRIKDALDDDVFSAAGKDVFQEARKAKASFESGLSRAKVSKFDSRKSNVLRDILENKIGADELTDKLVFSKTKRPEDLSQVIEYLRGGGEEAIKDLKADVLDKIKTRAFIGAEDASGFQTLGAERLQRTIDSIGWPKINALFDKNEVKFLHDMIKVSKLRQPVRGTALGKGPSAQAVKSLEQKLKNVPLLSILIDVVDYDAAGRAVLKAKPSKLVRQAGDVERTLPGALSAAVVAGALETEQSK